MGTKEQAEQIINKAIQYVAFKYNAYVPIISAFRIVYSDIVPTLGVDKYARLIVNPQFIVDNEKHAQGLIIHEVLHVFFGHTEGTRSRLTYTDDVEKNERINIAEDCAINQFILESLPGCAITPSTLARVLPVQEQIMWEQNAEYYLDIIEKYAQPHAQTESAESSTQTDSMSPEGSLSPADSTHIANTQKVQDELEKMGIKHVSEEEINDRMMQTATEICKSSGAGYRQLADFARKMLEPKIDWRPLLTATLRNAEKKVWNIHTKPTYKRTSRRSTQILLPKKYGHKIAVALSFDTSSSITTEMVNQFLSEVKGCMRYSEIKECALWNTDNYWYGSPEQLERDITKVFQDGGTYESCMGQAEAHTKADLYIHFSDGYHGDDYEFTHPHKNIEIVWDNNNIKEIRRF